MGKASSLASSPDKVLAQGAGSSSQPKQEVGETSAGPIVMVEHTGPPVRLTKQPASVNQGVLDASGTTDKSSSDNLVGKLTIREVDSSVSSDENDVGATSTATAGCVRTSADNGDVLGGSRRRAPMPSASSASLA